MAEEKIQIDFDHISDTDEAGMIAGIIKSMIDRRHELGLTQRAFAEQCGLSHSAIARMESGRQIPNLTTLTKLLIALGLTVRVVPSEEEDHSK